MKITKVHIPRILEMVRPDVLADTNVQVSVSLKENFGLKEQLNDEVVLMAIY